MMMFKGRYLQKKFLAEINNRIDNYFENNPAAATATLTPTKLLLSQPDLYMNEMNPFDQDMFNTTKLNIQMQPNSQPVYYEQQEQQQSIPSTDNRKQEPLKKERKKLLEKNREAAYRCRQKKKRYVHDLEERSKTLEEKNTDLQTEVIKLKEESIYLRNLILTHGNCDCQGMVNYYNYFLYSIYT